MRKKKNKQKEERRTELEEIRGATKCAFLFGGIFLLSFFFFGGFLFFFPFSVGNERGWERLILKEIRFAGFPVVGFFFFPQNFKNIFLFLLFWVRH